LREVDQEKQIFGETESFVTPGYKEQLQKNRAWEEELKQRDSKNSDVTQKKGLSEFYNNLLSNNVAFGTAKSEQEDDSGDEDELIKIEQQVLKENEEVETESTSTREDKPKNKTHKSSKSRSKSRDRDNGSSSRDRERSGSRDNDRRKSRSRDKNKRERSEERERRSRSRDRHNKSRGKEKRSGSRDRSDADSKKDPPKSASHKRKHEEEGEKHVTTNQVKGPVTGVPSKKVPQQKQEESLEDRKSKFAKRNTDTMVQAARERFLKRINDRQAATLTGNGK